MLIPAEEVTNPKVLDVFNQAFMEAEIDADGDVKVMIDGTKLFFSVTEGKPFLRVFALWGIKQGKTRMQMLELCNRLNDHMIMVRFCIPDSTREPAMYADHFTMLAGGITPQEIVEIARRFVSVVRGGYGEYDTEDVIA